ncbi:similarity to thyakoid membrane protein (nucleomorph) [Guillardia theta]|uniref:Similarity to thyakoid membrane protein n=1 Tax=Guillardia theta TaxID=55529 RepID=Q98RN5_GUITH|nr:similarity to thyakoid membrane protein [Guillardia theta]AAK39912.1 similarity to thyakoid membrane protein [Guillardia theta]
MFIKSTLLVNYKIHALNYKKHNFNLINCFLKRNAIQIKPNKNISVNLIGPSGGILGVGSSELIVIGIVAWLVLGP